MEQDELQNQNQVLDLYEKELGGLSTSVFAPYKTPKNLYENLINCWAVDLELKRCGDASKCQLEKNWRELKMNKFPQGVMEAVIERASQKINIF